MTEMKVDTAFVRHPGNCLSRFALWSLMPSVFPEIRILRHPPLKVFIPLEDATGRNKSLCGVWQHLGLRHSKGRGEVVQTVQHLLGELQEGVHGGHGGAGHRDLLSQLLQSLH